MSSTALHCISVSTSIGHSPLQLFCVCPTSYGSLKSLNYQKLFAFSGNILKFSDCSLLARNSFNLSDLQTDYAIMQFGELQHSFIIRWLLSFCINNTGDISHFPGWSKHIYNRQDTNRRNLKCWIVK